MMTAASRRGADRGHRCQQSHKCPEKLDALQHRRSVSGIVAWADCDTRTDEMGVTEYEVLLRGLVNNPLEVGWVT